MSDVKDSGQSLKVAATIQFIREAIRAADDSDAVSAAFQAACMEAMRERHAVVRVTAPGHGIVVSVHPDARAAHGALPAGARGVTVMALHRLYSITGGVPKAGDHCTAE